MVDAHVSGACEEIRKGSSPFFGSYVYLNCFLHPSESISEMTEIFFFTRQGNISTKFFMYHTIENEVFMNILIVIDALEFKYFEFNDLVTNFWLIKEFLERGFKVAVTLKHKLFIKNSKGFCFAYETKLENGNIFRSDEYSQKEINEFETVFFRPDPPVDVNYLNACHVFDFVDKTKTRIINDPWSVAAFNEKIHTNLFPEFIPESVITADKTVIHDFLDEIPEAVIKPLNRCFGSGIFKLKKGDANTNAIIDTATSNGTTMVCVQKYLGNGGDKRAFIIGNKVFDFSLRKLPGKEDFRFNTHSDEFFKAEILTPEELRASETIAEYLNANGMPVAALDIIEGKVTEINVTSPCFFIRETNRLFGIKFQDMIMPELLKFTKQTEGVR